MSDGRCFRECGHAGGFSRGLILALPGLVLAYAPLAQIGAQEIQESPQQSRTGPTPPPEVLGRDAIRGCDDVADSLTEVTLAVPAYLWRHGCGPTAVGMVAGYYDGNGYDDLIPGSAGTQTTEVNQAIASGGSSANPWPPGSERHYEDYARPQDSYPNLLTDDYITKGRTAHADDCIADYMDTSKSTRSNYYGWSWSSDVGPAWVGYVTQQSAAYQPSFQQYRTAYGTLTWAVLTAEIDAGRPMVFLVDTNGNNETDHFVPVVGYRTSPTNQYGCWDTWSTAGIRWENFATMGSGVPWGIWGGWRLQISIFPVHNVTGNTWHATIQAAIDAANTGDEIVASPTTYHEVIDFKGKAVTLRSSDGPSATRIDGTGLNDSVVKCVTSEGDGTVLQGFTISGGVGHVHELVRCGGGMFNLGASPTVIDCVFRGNTAVNGGGMCDQNNSSPRIINCNFGGNTADDMGGAIYNAVNSSPAVTNCTIRENSAGSGGGMFSQSASNAAVTNCILWSNAPDQIHDLSSSSNVTYSDVQGGSGQSWFGTGCIDQDPLFVSGSNGGDYLSQTAAGQAQDSPCVDAGRGQANQTYHVGTTRTDATSDSGNVDMGYHYRPKLVARGDLDSDQDVDGFDFLTFSNCYNGSNRPALAGCGNWRADIDVDEDADGFDFLTFSNCYNGSNRPPLCGP